MSFLFSCYSPLSIISLWNVRVIKWAPISSHYLDINLVKDFSKINRRHLLRLSICVFLLKNEGEIGIWILKRFLKCIIFLINRFILLHINNVTDNNISKKYIFKKYSKRVTCFHTWIIKFSSFKRCNFIGHFFFGFFISLALELVILHKSFCRIGIFLDLVKLDT